MAPLLNPYFNFDGNAREALAFYAELFGGEPSLNTYAEFGQEGTPHADKIMHGRLDASAGFTIMAADSPPGTRPTSGDTVSISLSGSDDALRTWWAALTANGTVAVPLEKQMWGDEWGMCTDQFGITWQVNITQA